MRASCRLPCFERFPTGRILGVFRTLEMASDVPASGELSVPSTNCDFACIVRTSSALRGASKPESRLTCLARRVCEFCNAALPTSRHLLVSKTIWKVHNPLSTIYEWMKHCTLVSGFATPLPIDTRSLKNDTCCRSNRTSDLRTQCLWESEIYHSRFATNARGTQEDHRLLASL